MSDHPPPNLFVLTGGPGSGKTTLLAEMALRGFAVSQEAGRGIIRQQQAIGGDAVPWADRSRFAELMLSWELRSHGQALAAPGPWLFDRGVPDIVGYLRLSGLPVPAPLMRAVATVRYHPTVFVAPHWPEIYVRDAERRQSPEEAEATCRMMIATYREFGYRTVVLPQAGVEARADFLAAHVGAARTRPRG